MSLKNKYERVIMRNNTPLGLSLCAYEYLLNLEQENKQLKEQLSDINFKSEYEKENLKFSKDYSKSLEQKLKQRDEVIEDATKKIIKWDSSSTCAIDDYYFKEEILEILQKYKGDNK